MTAPWCHLCRRYGCIRRVHPDVVREQTERWYRERHRHPFDLAHVLTYASDYRLLMQAVALVSGQRYDRYL